VSEVELDPIVKEITTAFAAAGRVLDEAGLAALAEHLDALESTRAERVCAQLVAVALRLLRAEGERAVEIVAQMQILAALAVGSTAAENQFETVERAFPGLRSDRSLPAASAPTRPADPPVAPKVRRGLARED
jgi:hypothetical protein